MQAFTLIAEERIREALETGELQDVPGKGKPLPYGFLFEPTGAPFLPFKILRNAGFLPVPLMLRKEIEQKQEEAADLLERCRQRTQALRAEWAQRRQELEETVHESRSSWYARLLFWRRHTASSHVQRRAQRLHTVVERHRHTVRSYRRQYAELLEELNAKIAQLEWHCIQEEVRQTVRCSSLLELPRVDVAARLRAFDREFNMAEREPCPLLSGKQG